MSPQETFRVVDMPDGQEYLGVKQNIMAQRPFQDISGIIQRGFFKDNTNPEAIAALVRIIMTHRESQLTAVFSRNPRNFESLKQYLPGPLGSGVVWIGDTAKKFLDATLYTYEYLDEYWIARSDLFDQVGRPVHTHGKLLTFAAYQRDKLAKEGIVVPVGNAALSIVTTSDKLV